MPILTKPQAEFFYSEASNVAAVAGFGSGKTEVALFRCTTTMFQNPGINMAYLAPTFPLIDDIWFPKIEEYFEKNGIDYSIDRSKHNVFIPGYGIIFCRSMEKPQRIVGFECGDILLDELDILPTDKALESVRKAKARARQKFKNGKKNQLFVTTTPEGFKATYKLFKKDPIPGSHLVQMSTTSNARNLPPDYIANLRDMYPPALLKAYVNGEFVNLQSDTVYSYFNREANHTDETIRSGDSIYIGQDFNIGGCASMVFVLREGKPRLVEEFISRDTFDVAENIISRYGKHNVTVFPDRSGNKSTTNATASDFSILRDAGIKLSHGAKNPFVRDRVNAVNILLSKGDLLINTRQCPLATEALEAQAYNAKTGQPEKSNEPGSFDDINDAIGYFCYSMFRQQRKPTISIT